MTRTHLVIATAAVLLLVSLPASAQAPFFGGGGIFDPEIDVVESGMLLDATAVVSADRKYVTMTMRPQSTQLLAIQEFAFQTGGGRGGAVGGGAVNGAAAGAGAGFGAAADEEADDRRDRREGRGATSSPATARKSHTLQGRPYPSPQAAAGRGVPLLEKPGMTLVGRVGRGTGR